MEAVTQHIASIPPAIEQGKGLHFNDMVLEGIEELEQLTRNEWTNYNASDPGIVMLENLCFGLLNLGYKSSFPMADLLTNAKGKLKAEGHFFKPSEIMFTNPVTINDFRRLLLDKVSELKNVWIKVGANVSEYEVRFELSENPLLRPDQTQTARLHLMEKTLMILNHAQGLLKTFKQGGIKGKLTNSIENYEILLAYLHNVLVEHQAALTESLKALFREWIKAIDKRRPSLYKPKKRVKCLQKQLLYLRNFQSALSKEIGVVSAIDAYLMRHRNLGEYFCDPLPIIRSEIQLSQLLKAIYLDNDVVLEKVLARIIYDINDYFSPFLKRQTYAELIEAGFEPEEILNGPAMDNGYITDQPLAKEPGAWHSLPISKRIMSISGVGSVTMKRLNGKNDRGHVRYIMASGIDIFNDVSVYQGSQKLDLTQDPKNGEFNQYPGLHQRIINAYHDLVVQNELPGGLPKTELFPKLPSGEHRDIANYQSIQHLFPNFYGLNNAAQLPALNGPEAVPIKQMKAYLMLFEQVLANHQSQLAGMDKLFGFGRHKAYDTYLTQGLYNSPGAQALLKSFDGFIVENDTTEQTPSLNWSTFKKDLSNGYVSHLRTIQASEKDQIKRRDEFLSHQLAIFGGNYNTEDLISFNPNYGDYHLARVKTTDAILEKTPLVSKNLCRSYFYYQDTDKKLLAGMEIKLGLLYQINGYYQGLLDIIDQYIYQRVDPKSSTIRWEGSKLSYQGQVLLDLDNEKGDCPVAKKDKKYINEGNKPLYCFARTLRQLIKETEGFVLIDTVITWYAYSGWPPERNLVRIVLPKEVKRVNNSHFRDMLKARLLGEGPLTAHFEVVYIDFNLMTDLLKERKVWLDYILKLQNIRPDKKPQKTDDQNGLNGKKPKNDNKQPVITPVDVRKIPNSIKDLLNLTEKKSKHEED